MPDWDAIFAEQGRVFIEPHSAIERITKVFQTYQVKRVLDLGCGTGRHLVHLSRQGFEVYGFDKSPKALSIACEWLAEEHLVADVREHMMEEPFPYLNDFFDAVISTQVIHHNRMENIMKTVSEIGRVLRRAGVLFVTFPIFANIPQEGKEDWNLKPIEPGTYIPRSGPEAGIPHHYFEIEEIPGIFSDFKILEIFTDDANHRCVLGIKK